MTNRKKQTNPGTALYPMTFFTVLLSSYNKRLDAFTKDLSPIRVKENQEQIEKVIASYPEESLHLSYALLAYLGPKGQSLMTSRFKEGKTLRQLAKEYGISHQRIYQLQNKYLHRLQSEKSLMNATLVFFGLSSKPLTEGDKQQAVRQLLSNSGNRIAAYEDFDLNHIFGLAIETQDELNDYLRLNTNEN